MKQKARDGAPILPIHYPEYSRRAGMPPAARQRVRPARLGRGYLIGEYRYLYSPKSMSPTE